VRCLDLVQQHSTQSTKADRLIRRVSTNAVLRCVNERCERSRLTVGALQKLGMRGLSKTFTFLRPGDGNATTLIRWIPDLVHQIIGQNQD
jgi:hypothetical protein